MHPLNGRRLNCYCSRFVLRLILMLVQNQSNLYIIFKWSSRCICNSFKPYGTCSAYISGVEAEYFKQEYSYSWRNIFQLSISRRQIFIFFGLDQLCLSSQQRHQLFICCIRYSRRKPRYSYSLAKPNQYSYSFGKKYANIHFFSCANTLYYIFKTATAKIYKYKKITECKHLRELTKKRKNKQNYTDTVCRILQYYS